MYNIIKIINISIINIVNNIIYISIINIIDTIL